MKRPLDKEKDITTSLNKYLCPQRRLLQCLYSFFTSLTYATHYDEKQTGK